MQFKNKIKWLAKKLVGKPELIFSSADYTKADGALTGFIEEYSDFLLQRRGFGTRDNEAVYGPVITKMEPDYDFFNSGIYKQNPNQKAIFEYDNFHSGTPMKYKPFPGSVRKVKKVLRRKNLYWYPRSAGGYYDQQSIVDYLLREGFGHQSKENSTKLGVDNIVFTCSTTHAYSLIINTITKPGDVILMTAPNYGLFAVMTETSGRQTELVKLREEDGWLVNPSVLARRIDELNRKLGADSGGEHRVVAFLNLNPHNPTGKTMGRKHISLLRKIGEVCKERNVFVIDDLVYRDLTYDLDDLAIPIASFPEYFDNTISLFGLSKAYGLASLRAAVIVAPKAVAEVLTQEIHNTIDSVPVLQVAAVSGAFNGTNRRYCEYRRYMQKQIEEYKFRYQLIRALVYGIDEVEDAKLRRSIIRVVSRYVKVPADREKLLSGCPNLAIRAGTEPDSGFFVLFDFTKLKDKATPDGRIIKNERELLDYFFRNGGLSYLMGGNICWPKPDEMVARISFGVSRKAIVRNMLLMNKAIRRLK